MKKEFLFKYAIEHSFTQNTLKVSSPPQNTKNISNNYDYLNSQVTNILYLIKIDFYYIYN